MSAALLVEVQDIDFANIANPEFDQEYGSRIKSSTNYIYYDNGQVKSVKDANGNAAAGNETTFLYDMDKHVTEKNEILRFRKI